jgi:hypothetical protein
VSGGDAQARRAAREARRAALRPGDGASAQHPEPPTEQEEGESDPPRRAAPPRRERRPREGARAGAVETAVRRAREQLRELHGADAESVSSFEQTGNGCAVTLEVVEVRRVPETTDVLASYRVELDERGDLLSYRRVRRYHRSEALEVDGA